MSEKHFNEVYYSEVGFIVNVGFACPGCELFSGSEA